MSPFSHEQEAAIRSLIALWGRDRIVLIGGAALAALTGMSWRATQDIDLVVMAELEVSTRQLASQEGWRKVPDHEPRWMFHGEVLADILPVTPPILRAGRLRWPRSGVVMSTAGLELARTSAIPFSLSDGAALLVAPLPVIGLLKMVSFLDRPQDRARDLTYIALVLHDFVADVDDRRFDARFEALDVRYDEGSAFLLGEELRRIAAAHVPLIERFLQEVEVRSVDTMALGAPPAWRRDRAALERQRRALRIGLAGVGP